jgi:hypothetical protein
MDRPGWVFGFGFYPDRRASAHPNKFGIPNPFSIETKFFAIPRITARFLRNRLLLNRL